MKIIEEELSNRSCEFAMLGVAEKKDKYFLITKVVSCERETANSFTASVPKELQIKILKYCRMNEFIPVVIHSHVHYNYLKFSPIDTEFEQSMVRASVRIGGKSELISILFGNEEFTARRWKNGKELKMFLIL